MFLNRSSYGDSTGKFCGLFFKFVTLFVFNEDLLRKKFFQEAVQLAQLLVVADGSMPVIVGGKCKGIMLAAALVQLITVQLVGHRLGTLEELIHRPCQPTFLPLENGQGPSMNLAFRSGRLVKSMEWVFQDHNFQNPVFSQNKGHVLKTSGRNGSSAYILGLNQVAEQ
ncbi:hypothetical protein P8452_03004 [Trifolium repens]|nr:hypothetical protein P8452_03004 [Trifolium repens]